MQLATERQHGVARPGIAHLLEQAPAVAVVGARIAERQPRIAPGHAGVQVAAEQDVAAAQVTHAGVDVGRSPQVRRGGITPAVVERIVVEVHPQLQARVIVEDIGGFATHQRGAAFLAAIGGRVGTRAAVDLRQGQRAAVDQLFFAVTQQQARIQARAEAIPKIGDQLAAVGVGKVLVAVAAVVQQRHVPIEIPCRTAVADLLLAIAVAPRLYPQICSR